MRAVEEIQKRFTLFLRARDRKAICLSSELVCWTGSFQTLCSPHIFDPSNSATKKMLKVVGVKQ